MDENLLCGETVQLLLLSGSSKDRRHNGKTSGTVDMVRVLGELWDPTGYSSCLEMVGNIDTGSRAPVPKGGRLILEVSPSDHGPEAPKHRVPT